MKNLFGLRAKSSTTFKTGGGVKVTMPGIPADYSKQSLVELARQVGCVVRPPRTTVGDSLAVATGRLQGDAAAEFVKHALS